MLKKAENKKCYKELKEIFLGDGKFPTELEGKFEVAVSSGLLACGHVKSEIFREKIKCLKSFTIPDEKVFWFLLLKKSTLKNLDTTKN
mmetsp:Transcript_24391/g.28053  ORF Transcript_24391/g.28053 Transcript_24391/m.28053 type:complete len:88 (+) Transcript_24391:304-567(+)